MSEKYRFECASCGTVAEMDGEALAQALGPAQTRRLRRLATFARRQQTFGQVLDVEDELRAVALLVRTLEQLPREARGRALAYIQSRHHDDPANALAFGLGPQPAPQVPVSYEESVRIARDRVLGPE